jgi:hypothetical protein
MWQSVIDMIAVNIFLVDFLIIWLFEDELLVEWLSWVDAFRKAFSWFIRLMALSCVFLSIIYWHTVSFKFKSMRHSELLYWDLLCVESFLHHRCVCLMWAFHLNHIRFIHNRLFLRYQEVRSNTFRIICSLVMRGQLLLQVSLLRHFFGWCVLRLAAAGKIIFIRQGRLQYLLHAALHWITVGCRPIVIQTAPKSYRLIGLQRS